MRETDGGGGRSHDSAAYVLVTHSHDEPDGRSSANIKGPASRQYALLGCKTG
jgi:hypothetical protein